MDSLIILHTADGRCRLDLDHTVIIGAGFGIALIFEGIGKGKVGSIGNSGCRFAQLLPGAVGQQLLQNKVKLVAFLPLAAIEGLVAGHGNAHRIDLCRFVAVDNCDRNCRIRHHSHYAVASHAIVPVGRCEAGIKFRLHNGGCGTDRQAEHLELLLVL